jgi:hypothetical protein
MEASYKARAEREKQGTPQAEAKDLLPIKYKAGATSGLTAEVKPEGKNDYTFDLAE